MIASDFAWVHRVGRIYDVRVAARRLRDAIARGLALGACQRILRPLPNTPLPIHFLVAQEEVRLSGGLLEVREDLVSRVDREHVDQFWLFNRAAVLAIADINHHGTDTTLRRVGDAIANPKVVNARVRMLVFTDVLGLGQILHVDDDILLTAGDCEEVIVGGEHVVHTTSQLLIKRRRDFRMCRHRKIENHHTIHAIGRAFARQRRVPSVG